MRPLAGKNRYRGAMSRPLAAFVLVLLACGTPKAEAPTSPTREVAPIEAEPGGAPEPKPTPAPAATDDAKATPETKAGGEQRTEIRAGTDPCKTDADCVRGSCCHADSCVAKANAPDCKDAVCTLECRSGTMDCGGGCLCQNGKCAAKVVIGFE